MTQTLIQSIDPQVTCPMCGTVYLANTDIVQITPEGVALRETLCPACLTRYAVQVDDQNVHQEVAKFNLVRVVVTAINKELNGALFAKMPPNEIMDLLTGHYDKLLAQWSPPSGDASPGIGKMCRNLAELFLAVETVKTAL